MPDYKKCVIYTIRTGEGLYVGSTCNFKMDLYNILKEVIISHYKSYARL